MTTPLYSPAIDPALSALNFLAGIQVPTSPAYPSSLSLSADIFTDLPDLLASATTSSDGITLNTDGSSFDGKPGFSVSDFLNEDFTSPSASFVADADTGYVGFTNYTIEGELEDITPAQIVQVLAGFLDVEDLFEDVFALQILNEDFPELNPVDGFTLDFDLTISEESSASNRAGFSLLVVTHDPTKEIELGFKTAGDDRIFAQGVNFTEAEDSSAFSLDLSATNTFSLSVSGDSYSLAANGVDILSGDLRDYAFDPATSSPPLPESANPYQIPNLVFFGDNTDQAHATFTLGEVSISPLASEGDGLANFLSYEKLLRFQNPDTTVPTDQINGLAIAQFFDEDFYLNQNPDVAAAVRDGAFTSGYQHYLFFGFTEGRDPSVLFNEEYYFSTHNDVEQAVNAGAFESGIAHFVIFGQAEGRAPSELFDQADYLINNSDVQAAIDGGAFQSAFDHYIEFGLNESRLPQLSLYNEQYYLQNNPDVESAITQGAFVDGLQHYALFGQREGRNPSSLFNETTYLGLHSDVQAAVDAGAFTSGFDHYIEFGRFEGRQATA